MLINIEFITVVVNIDNSGYKILLITLWLLKLDVFTLNSLLQRLNEECQYVINYYKIKDLSQHIITAYVFSSLFTQYSVLNFSLQLVRSLKT